MPTPPEDSMPIPLPIDDTIDYGTAFNLMATHGDKESYPTACCNNCGEPLVGTMKWKGAEFVCMMCGRLHGYLSPIPKESTPELKARQAEMQKLYDSGAVPGHVGY